ncbi:hypothetical protein EUX98_g4322 [Antrodiella citrinella]|uniref:Uncharacterized protein n=1 Tax=Antrodiella citrinella TaxID=2447956 RepID=A0A4S4N279_9APHY|nr:hypothetical protein EUX98_g4322 [Antrodiella citrinella]
MPPAKTGSKPPSKPSGKPSTSRELVTVGPREVFAKHHGRRNEDGQRPSTARALVLRNGKHGARGTGEVILLNKMSGREKLELLAEDLMEKNKRALATPFRLDQCMKIAESQFMANLDETEELQDPAAFQDKIKAEVNARKPSVPTGKHADPFKNVSYVASIAGSKIHNTYMFASAWRLIAETLDGLQKQGLEEQKIRAQLEADTVMRSKYLALYSVVNTLAGAYQERLAQFATTTPHYAQYFRPSTNPETSEPVVGFEFASMKLLHKSFLDSIIIELCLPNPSYPRHILYMLLQEAMEESPRDLKRFHQLLWDAVGDLSDTVKLLEMLEGVLLSPEGEKWKQEPQEKPEHYEEWLDAQWLSAKACAKIVNWRDIIFPLERTKTPNTLKNMWKAINVNYKEASGLTIDELWRLRDLQQRVPQWHAIRANQADDEDDEDDVPPGLAPKKKASKAPKAITNGDESDDSMPSLQTVSDSDDEEDDLANDSNGDNNDESDSDSEEDYDTDDEDQLRDMFREAMDTAIATELFDNADSAEFDSITEDRKGNPFIKLLGALRGRMFSANPTVKTSDAQARQPSDIPRRAAAPRTTPAAADSVPRKATVEEVEDEDDIAAAAKKKKKKKPRKKKKPAAASEIDLVEPESTPQSSVVPPSPAPSAAVPQSPAPTTPKKKKPAAPKPTLSSASTTSLFGSATSLPLPHEQTAQSARSYLQSVGLTNAGKSKVKTRRDPTDLGAIPEKKKKSMFARFVGRDDMAENEDEDEDEEDGDKHGFFKNLTKKTSNYMHQLIGGTDAKKGGIAPLKWENFLKLMREMGFEYDPSTAGSSVRFDPPHSRDPSITFHKPHPDPTLYPNHLRSYGKRLKDYYGWNEEDFIRNWNSRAGT